MQQVIANNVLALDVGAKRIGIARASLIAKLAAPLITLPNDDNFMTKLKELIKNEDIGNIVVGLPRGLQGQDTDQTRVVREFAKKLEVETQLPIALQDEALTSVQAETELKQRTSSFDKQDIDALAATYILEDYLRGIGVRNA